MNEPEAVERLAALLDGTISPDDAPPSLAGLLTLASTVRDAAELHAPSVDFRAALRAQLVAASTTATAPTLAERTRAAWATRNAQLRSSTRVMVATMTASGMLSTAGMAVAAQEALPGDALYAMKGWTEQARLFLATSEIEEARLHLAFAAERLDELEAGTGQLTEDEIVDLLRRMDESSQAGADALLEGVINGTVSTAELQAFTDSQRDRLSRVLGDLPTSTQPVAKESLALLQAIDSSVTGIVPSADAAGDVAVLTPLAPAAVVMDRDAVAPTSERGSATAPTATADPVELLDLGDGVFRRGEPEASRGDGDGSDEPEEEPFEAPGDTFTHSPEVEDDDEVDDGSVGVGNSVSTLPMETVADGVEDATGAEPDTGALERTIDAVDTETP